MNEKRERKKERMRKREKRENKNKRSALRSIGEIDLSLGLTTSFFSLPFLKIEESKSIENENEL